MLTINILLWIMFVVCGLGQPKTKAVLFRGQAQDYNSHQSLPAIWRWADAADHTVLERRTNADGFADFVPEQAQFLTIVSDGYRTVRLPVHWPRNRTDPVRFRAIIPLVPVDKMTANQPYFQSEQRPMRLSPAGINTRIPVRFVVYDALTNQPVRADLRLFFTRSHTQSRYVTNALRTELFAPDIVAIEARTSGYQPYLGNLIVSDSVGNGPLLYKIRLNPTPTIFMATVLEKATSGNFQLKAIPAGLTYRVAYVDSTSLVASVPPGRYQLTGRFSTNQPFRDTIQLQEGLNGYIYPSTQFVAVVDEPLERTIYFEQSSYQLSDLAKQQLDQIAQLMQQDLHRHLRITGHTDNVGDGRLNTILSEFRARATKAYLHQRGIREERLHLDAVGAGQPVAPNDTEENRRRNRRVSLQFR